MNDEAPLLRERVYRSIRSDILDCRLAPGQDMRECDLAARLEVSRQPVRDALQRLQKERLVLVEPRQGYRVAPISVADARHLLDFRLVLEPACAAAACEAASDEELTALDAHRVFADWTEPDRYIAYNRRFHTAVAEASGNGRMAAAARELIEQSERLVVASLQTLELTDQPRLVAQHVAIIEAMQRRDRRVAERLVRDHVESARKRIIAALGRSPVVP